MDNFKGVKYGLAMAFMTFLFGLGLAVVFDFAEVTVRESIMSSLVAHPVLHGADGFAKIFALWRELYLYAMATGVLALVLVCVTALSSLRRPYKVLVSILVGLSGLYPLALLRIALLAPSSSIGSARDATSVNILIVIAIVSLLIAIAMLVLNIFIGNWSTCNAKTCSID